MDEKAMKIWSTWAPDLINDDYAKKRIKSAQSKKLTPVKVDYIDLYAYFQGSHGRYETFLDSCPCGDFKRSGRPCKHIFRLAMELGLLNEDYQSDLSFIPPVRKEMLPLGETIDKVEELSDEAQKKLLRLVVAISSDIPHITVEKDDVCVELLDSGIIENLSGNSPRVFKFGVKKDLVSNLERLGLEFDPKMKKADLEAYCSENYPDQMSLCYHEKIQICVAPQYNKRKMHYYLHRKYDYEIVYDGGEGGFSTHPLLETVLPDDDVTAQLIRRGYYHQKSRNGGGAGE